MKTAVLYASVSSQGDRQSVARQVADLVAYAERNDICILRTFTEKDSDAELNQARSVLTGCLEFCRNEHPDTMLVSELSSLGRETTEILAALRLLNEAGVSLFIYSMGIHTLQEESSPGYVASVLIPLLSEVARIEQQSFMERLNSGRERYKEAGGYLGRPKGSCKSPEQLREEYPGVVKRLQQRKDENAKLTMAEIAQLEKVSISTVHKVKKAVTVWFDPHGGKNDLMWKRLEMDEESL